MDVSHRLFIDKAMSLLALMLAKMIQDDLHIKQLPKCIFISPANLGPYHFARFTAIARLLPDFTVVQVQKKEDYRPWSGDLGKPPCRIITLDRDKRIEDLLSAENPDVVFTVSYVGKTFQRAAWWAKRRKIPSILVNDSWYGDRSRFWWKEKAKRFLVKRLFDGAFVAGKRAEDYAVSLGLPPNLIWKGLDVVDNNHFSNSSEDFDKSKKLPEKFFLCVTRLSPEKNVNSLLLGFQNYIHSGGDWHLVIAGTGPQEIELKKKVSVELETFIHWMGWVSYYDLPYIYSKASCFVLSSSSETWGLVVNEGMAAGLPVLVSRKCGCMPELCQKGINGYDFDPNNVEKLAELMLRMSSGLIDLNYMGEASKRIIECFTPETWARTLFNCVTTMVEPKRV